MTVAASVLLPSFGCDNPVICTLDVKPALVVEVRDAATGEPAATGTAVSVKDGDFEMELAAFPMLAFRVRTNERGSIESASPRKALPPWSSRTSS
jgi:hypothetical protein